MLGVLLPHRARELRTEHQLGYRARPDRADHLDGCRDAALSSRRHQIVPAPERRVGHQERVGLLDLLRGSEPLGVVGDDQEIERAAELDGLAGGRDDLLPAREAISGFRSERVPERSRVQRIRRMEMGVAPEHARGIRAPGIGRISRRLVERSDLIPVERPDVGRCLRGGILGARVRDGHQPSSLRWQQQSRGEVELSCPAPRLNDWLAPGSARVIRPADDGGAVRPDGSPR